MQQNVRQISEIVQGTFTAAFSDSESECRDCDSPMSDVEELSCLWKTVINLSKMPTNATKAEILDSLITVSV